MFPTTASGNVAPARVIDLGFIGSIGQLSVLDDEIYASSFRSDSVLVFARDASGSAVPLRRITGPLTQVRFPSAALAF